MSDNKKEVRFACREMRASGNKNKPQLFGYAAKYNSQTELMPGLFEVIRPGAFKRTVAEKADVRCLFNHDEDIILGRTKSGTLRLREDTTGLYFECDVPDTTAAQDVYKSVQRGDIDQCSFGFSLGTAGDRFTKTSNGEPLRELLDLDLFDVSVVTYPAYTSTSAEARSLAMWPNGKPERLAGYCDLEFERELRNDRKAVIAEVQSQTECRQRVQKLLDEIAAEEIERQKKRLNAALL